MNYAVVCYPYCPIDEEYEAILREYGDYDISLITPHLEEAEKLCIDHEETQIYADELDAEINGGARARLWICSQEDAEYCVEHGKFKKNTVFYNEWKEKVRTFDEIIEERYKE